MNIQTILSLNIFHEFSLTGTAILFLFGAKGKFEVRK
jgi:hypothetical protein